MAFNLPGGSFEDDFLLDVFVSGFVGGFVADSSSGTLFDPDSGLDFEPRRVFSFNWFLSESFGFDDSGSVSRLVSGVLVRQQQQTGL